MSATDTPLSSWPAPPDPPELPAGVTPSEHAPAWGWKIGLLGFVTWFVGVNVLATIIILAIAGPDGADDPPPGALISATFVQDLLLIGVAVLFARFAAGNLPTRAWHFGLRKPPRAWLSLGWLLVAYVGFIAFSAAWVAILGIDQEDELLDELGVDESAVALVFSALLVTVMAPLSEELFFRGFLFRALKGSAGLWVAAIVSGVIFGAIHLGSSPIGFVVPLMVFGFGLALLYQATGSLWPPIVLHAINNSIAFGVNQDWDWQILPLLGSSLAVLALVAFVLRRVVGPSPSHLSPV